MLGVQDIRFAVYSVCMATTKKIAVKSGIHQINRQNYLKPITLCSSVAAELCRVIGLE